MALKHPSLAGISAAKKHIRQLFYFGALSTVILLAATLTYFHVQNLTEEFTDLRDQLSNSLMEEKKRFLQNAVEQTIAYIQSEGDEIHQEHANDGLSEETLQSLVKAELQSRIRNMRLVDNGYFWINQIINYDGGDRYAIRLVHPNLPETEGSWLSTNTTDIKGNKPYEMELEGVKQHGEIFIEYYFKKMTSDIIAHKMAYAKLYKPYDWVVATGVYLDDVDALIAHKTQQMEQTYSSQIRMAISISLTAIFLAAAATFQFEKYILRLISNYEATIDNYTTSLEKLSNTDVLTGLDNRLKLDEIFLYELHQMHRYEGVFSILLLDLDRFKDVNDTYGHQTGDEVLKETARLLEDCSRSTDTVGRWGGEEFLIIMPKTSGENALLMAEKIRKAIAEHDFPGAKDLTCSIGISSYRENDDAESMLKRADTALYRAKENGRNRVEFERLTPEGDP